MRISDWSSDVCSSDLDVPEAGEAATDGRGHCHPDVSPTHTGEVAEQPEHDAASLLGVGGLGDDEGCQRVEELRAGDAGQHNAPGGLQSRAAEIGRASCRERGWQYVENEVGAGSITKKKKRTSRK